MITTEEQRQAFLNDGFIMAPGMFRRAEIEAVLADLEPLNTAGRVAAAAGRNRGGMIVEDGRTARLQFDIHRTESRMALMCRHPRLAGVMQELMGMPLYLLHSKLAFKAPFTGSVQYWHQDYGYWRDQHAEPLMGSCFVMLDAHTEDNACMQVLAGSHRDGVVYHEDELRESTGDNQRRIPSPDMANYCRRYRRVKLIGEPGTLVAWHCNVMHASGHNISENPRRSIIVAFNAVGNSDPSLGAESPYNVHGEAPVTLTDDDCLLAGLHS